MSQAFDDCARAICEMLVSDLKIELNPDEIPLDAGLMTVMGLGEDGIWELRRLCERRFRVQISDDKVTPENFGTVRRLAYLIVGLPQGSVPSKNS
jgi:hypothetical protein